MTLDVQYLPADMTVDVVANFPTHGSALGTEQDVIAALPLEVAVQMNALFGQVVKFRKTFDCLVQGDGTWQMN